MGQEVLDLTARLAETERRAERAEARETALTEAATRAVKACICGGTGTRTMFRNPPEREHWYEDEECKRCAGLRAALAAGTEATKGATK